VNLISFSIPNASIMFSGHSAGRAQLERNHHTGPDRSCQLMDSQDCTSVQRPLWRNGGECLWSYNKTGKEWNSGSFNLYKIVLEMLTVSQLFNKPQNVMETVAQIWNDLKHQTTANRKQT
jgi:hypothetical protein